MTVDQELLNDYVRGRRDAFRELWERHGSLVFGVACRVTGDRSMAEEVVQDVFCLVARKAAVLAGHPSLTGWLHRTAMNTARTLRRRRISHERKLARFASEPGDFAATGESIDPVEIDRAVHRLSADERDVVLLRFYENAGYPQIGDRLGITEATARKRLSRALRKLQRFIEPGKVAALTPSGFALAPPPGLTATILSHAPAAAAPASGFLTTLTLMTWKQITATAAAVLITGGLSWITIDQARENHRLRAELDRLTETVSASSVSGRDGQAGSNPSGPGASPLAAELAALREELASERGKREAAEREAGELRTMAADLSDEVVVSFGKVTEIGNTLGTVFTEALALAEIEKKGELDTEENQIRVGKFIEKASTITGISQEIVQFEDNPEEGSQFVASIYGTVFGLSETERGRVADYFSEQLAQAGERELTLSHLPDRGSPEFGPWLEKRWAYFSEGRDTLRSLLPANKREQFDGWVEKGGYGFKNLSLKGMPLMFSLGGDPR